MSEERDRLEKVKRAIRGNFDRGAEDYAAFEDGSGFFGDLIGELMKLRPLAPGARVLDVGCGTGASLAALADAVGPEGGVTGIDISEEMLRKARERLGERVSLACADGCDFGEGLPRNFDAVVYNAVLFLLPDAAGSLACAAGVLRPGGAVLVASLERVTWNDRPVPDLLAEAGHKAGRHALSPWATVEPLLRSTFEGVTVRPWERALTPAMFRAFYGMEPMSAGLLPRLPYPERKEIVDELAARMAAAGGAIAQTWMLAAGTRR